MTSIPKFTAFVACFGLSAGLMAEPAVATPETCPEFSLVTVEGEAIALPVDLAGNVTMLQAYGTRYAKVIDLILDESARPGWTFGDDCAATDADSVASSD